MLTEQMQAGRQPKMNPDRARQRAEDLHGRLQRRMADLDREAQLRPLPPVVVGAVLVVPAGLLARLRGDESTAPALETAEVDRRAVAAVLAAEHACGRDPEEMPHNNRGYDIRSRSPDGHWTFVEVKGRLAGRDTVSVTRNEILTLKNAERSILALVAVSPDGPAYDRVRHLERPFDTFEVRTPFPQTGVTFEWRPMWEAGTEPR